MFDKIRTALWLKRGKWKELDWDNLKSRKFLVGAVLFICIGVGIALETPEYVIETLAIVGVTYFGAQGLPDVVAAFKKIPRKPGQTSKKALLTIAASIVITALGQLEAPEFAIETITKILYPLLGVQGGIDFIKMLKQPNGGKAQ